MSLVNAVEVKLEVTTTKTTELSMKDLNQPYEPMSDLEMKSERPLQHSGRHA